MPDSHHDPRLAVTHARRCITAALLVIGATFVGSTHASAQQTGATASDSAEVRAVLDAYFRGQATGDGSHFRPIFQPTANLYWIREGKYAERPSAEWMAGYTGKPADDEAQRRRRVASMDITGNAAAAKLVSEYPSALVTDYMSLLKTEAGWKVVAKTFVVQPRAH
jgi:hypothetical protein